MHKEHHMKVSKCRFGVLSDGTKVRLYTADNGAMSFSVTDYGCIITNISVPDKKGDRSDIVLGYSTLEGYLNDTKTYFGACIGRYANRIANARFSLNGAEYSLDANDGTSCLHGGFKGYNRTVWKAKPIEGENEAGVRFTRTSPAGEQGFPGKLKLEIEYILTKANELIFRYKAAAKEDTVVSLTNHSYYNLAGEGSGDILSHKLRLNASKYLPVDARLIPTGKQLEVEKSAFDFRSAKTIGCDIKKAGGYDHCFCIDENRKEYAKGAASGLYFCAEAEDEKSGRKMSVYTDCPGVQFYSGNFLDVPAGKNGMPYTKHAGFCLETERYPDSPNRPEFPSALVKAGETYESVTVHIFNA